MSWAQNLLKTYEVCEEVVGILDNNGNALLPIGYTMLKTHINIILDDNGNFVSAEKLESPEYIAVPCTEQSSTSRTSSIFPHPLFDQLKYVAGDYDTYSGKQYVNHFEKYIKGLEAWCKSPFTHPKVESIFKYLNKRSIIKDLKSIKVYSDDDLKKIKKVDGKQKLAVADNGVRFKVRIPGDFEERVWLDKSVREKYLQYLVFQQTNKDICYLTGEKTAISEKHPKGINSNAYSAKLISTNDSDNFTFRGRFTAATEAIAIGFESSQKLHQALRWLIATRASKCGKQAIVAWAVDRDADVESPLEDSLGIYETVFKTDADRLIKANSVTDFDYGLALRIALFSGCGMQNIKKHARLIVIMITDAATDNTGRMSITYYREFFEDQYHERIAEWHEQCRWYQLLENNRDKKREIAYFVGAPSVKRVVKAVLGKKPAKEGKSYEKLEKGIRERLLHCIIDGVHIPKDMLNSVLHRASNPQGLENKEAKSSDLRWRDWEEVLGVACGLWRRDYYKKGDEYKLELETNRTDRDYLYGRLLAVADKIESAARFKQGNNKDDSRATNAIRYMTAFSQHPFRTWKVLWDQLNPYIQQLNGADWYLNQISSILSNFPDGEYENDRPLDGSYLMGYFLQRQTLRTKNKNDNGGIKNESVEQN